MSEKYAFIDAECAILRRRGRCSRCCADVRMARCIDHRDSTTGGARPESETAQRRELAEAQDQSIVRANNEEYGYRRVHAALVRGGVTVDDETVRKVMREPGPGALPAQALAPLADRAGRPGRTDPGPGEP